ncbi:MAG: phosphoglycerate dehydrogenase [Phycisphaerae bacterium]
MSWRILVTAPYLQPVLGRFAPQLQAAGCDLVVPPVQERLEEHELLQVIGQIDGVICGDDRFTRRVFEAAPNLKVISKWGTGVDSIDREAAAEFGVRICRTPGAFTVPVADTVFAMMLQLARRTAEMDAHMKAGRWEKIPGVTLSELTLGVVGMGAIGTEVARRAKAFGMGVVGHDVREIPDAPATMVSLEVLLAAADVVTLHCDLNPTSHHLMNAGTLARMKPTAWLLNTSRGPVVHEAALVEALQSEWIAAAGLDVFEHEPLSPHSPLLGMSNVILAPHNSNSSPRAWQRVHRNTIANLLDGLRAEARQCA